MAKEQLASLSKEPPPYPPPEYRGREEYSESFDIPPPPCPLPKGEGEEAGARWGSDFRFWAAEAGEEGGGVAGFGFWAAAG